MQKGEKKQLEKIVADLKKVEDHMRELFANIEKAMEANDAVKVMSLFHELQAMHKTRHHPVLCVPVELSQGGEFEVEIQA